MTQIKHDDLVGVWLLQSFNLIDSDGKTSEWGKTPTGMLIYTSNGYMSVSINASLETKNSNNLEALFDSILFYSGRYEIQCDNTLVHLTTNASDPNRIGQSLIREVNFSNGDLCIVGKGSFGSSRLIWRRV